MLTRKPSAARLPEGSEGHVSLPLGSCLAKSVGTKDGYKSPGIDVETHSRIVGMVAKKLIELFPEGLRKQLFPQGSELAAAVHDVGKINPLFQEKIKRSLKDYQPNTEKALKDANPELERQRNLYHSIVSKAALYYSPPFIADIAGSHHGYPAGCSLLPEDAVIGGSAWQQERMALVEHMQQYFSQDWPEIEDDIHAAVLSGLTTVADWIGSGPAFDNILTIEPEALEFLAAEAVGNAGFFPVQVRKNLQFHDIFPEYLPNPMQSAMAQLSDRSGIYIVEALMGEGKTEAALHAAYHFLESGQASGIYFALPTRLTSEKIYDRFNEFLGKVLEDSDPHQALLLHGTSWLRSTDLGEDAGPGFSWFNSNKRGILAPFSVGTIDQALMAVMHVKHGFVRTFGLAGKVVVIDEIHTYDMYTGTIAEHLIQSLASLGCTVIILSATLTRNRISSLLNQPGGHMLTYQGDVPDHYPMITKAVPGKEPEFSQKLASENTLVNISHTNDYEYAFDEVKERAFTNQYVLWIENSVQEAQQVYARLGAWGRDNAIEVGLLHSRFLRAERQNLEAHWTGLYGKEGLKERALHATGKILIGTQILEQSLDIDADFLVSHLAPSDMLFQRIGRLWRHERLYGKRPMHARKEVLVISPEYDSVMNNPGRAFGPSGLIYSPYVLLRTLEVWKLLNSAIIPSDLRKIIESTYAEREEQGKLAMIQRELIKQKEKLKLAAYNSMASFGKALSDENPPTRIAELPSADVLLLGRDPDYEGGSIWFSDGTVIQIPGNPETASREEKKRLALQFMEHIVRVPSYHAPNALERNELRWLAPYLYISSEKEDRLRIAVLTQGDALIGLGNRPVHDTHNLGYSKVLGYIVRKKNV
ncbi:MAG: CRISPR-associated helicase Cas3' [Spirochaetia bacterium]|nr:CRISPR-associated helicase Cas3' [Spirochaetia bacterium]